MIKDRVFETSTTSGTGSYTLLGAITGARSFQDAFGAGPAKVYYFAVPANADGSFEAGIGTFTGPTTLERTSILASSNSDAAVDWGTETKNIFSAPPAGLLDRLNDMVNCGTAGGTGNAITLSPNVPVAEYAMNDIYIFTAGATNSGATIANVSTLGNKDVELNGAALVGGEIVNGQTYGFRHDGTALQLLFFQSIPTDTTASQIAYDPGSPALLAADNVQEAIDELAGNAASKSDQAAASSTTKFVTPATQQFHPSAAKAWGYFFNNGTIAASFNISSISDAATGVVDVFIDEDFDSANWVAIAVPGTTAGNQRICNIDANPGSVRAAGFVRINSYQLGGSLGDPNDYNFVAYGTRA